MSYKYKLTSTAEAQVSPEGFTLPGYGIIQPGGFIESATPIENPNLELVSDEGSAHLEGVVPQAVQSAPQTAESENK